MSTQSFVNNNAEMISEYSGDQAYKRSVQTYGGDRGGGWASCRGVLRARHIGFMIGD